MLCEIYSFRQLTPKFLNKLPVPVTFVTIFFVFVECIIKTIIRVSFCDIQKNQGLGKGYQPQPSALSILDITKTSSNNCLFNEYVGRKMQENLYIEQKKY